MDLDSEMSRDVLFARDVLRNGRYVIYLLLLDLFANT